MAESPDKKPIEALDEPRLPSHEIGETSDADMALAAMGYKPVRSIIFSGCFFSVLTAASNLIRFSSESLGCGLPSASPSAFLVYTGQ